MYSHSEWPRDLKPGSLEPEKPGFPSCVTLHILLNLFELLFALLKVEIIRIYLIGFVCVFNEIMNGKCLAQGLAPSKYVVNVRYYSLFIYP